MKGLPNCHFFDALKLGRFVLDCLTSAVNNGEKHLVDFIRQPDGKSLGILGQVT